MRRIDGPGIAAEALENPFNDRRRLDAGNDTLAADALAHSVPPAVLLREGWREGKRVRKRTLANLTAWQRRRVS